MCSADTSRSLRPVVRIDHITATQAGSNKRETNAEDKL